jgi:hypothetical protein
MMKSGRIVRVRPDFLSDAGDLELPILKGKIRPPANIKQSL